MWERTVARDSAAGLLPARAVGKRQQTVDARLTRGVVDLDRDYLIVVTGADIAAIVARYCSIQLLILIGAKDHRIGRVR